MTPEQKRLSATLRPGEAWSWQASQAPVRFRYSVIGPADVAVPAGQYHSVRLSTEGTVQTPVGVVRVHQSTWFVPGVGIVQQDTRTTLGARSLSHVILTLEKFEKP